MGAIADRKDLWTGRFAAELDPRIRGFTASLDLDRRIARHDVRGSIAHARMLGRQGIIPASAARALVDALGRIDEELEAGTFPWPRGAEDVHSAVEQALAQRVGEAAGRLHTARSRNDQVALDLRLFVVEALDALDASLRSLGLALIERAAEQTDTVLPGYTHLQRAEPASVATELGFGAIFRNSIDAVADRDFVAELAFVAALAAVHASRLAEELVLWTSAEFGFAEFSDEHATGSSIMPQKKNPDVAELVRGRAGRIIGDLVAILTTLKGLPLAYDGDLQEQRVPLYDAVTVAPALDTLALVVHGLRFDREAMRHATTRGMLAATDLADHLVSRGVPFREAHEVVGRIVRDRLDGGLDLDGLSADELRRYDARFGDDAAGIDVATSLAARRSPGGTAPERVRAALAEAKVAFEQ